MTTLEQGQQDALAIFENALSACDIDRAFDRNLHFEGKTLVRHPSPLLAPVRQSLEKYKRVLVISFGKAGAAMLDALMKRIPEGMDVRGLCSSSVRPAARYRHFNYYLGGHPVPNRESFAAAREALELLHKARKDTLVIFLISGGGSAMLEMPLDKRISLEDTTAFHETLVASGASITEVNTVRKFFSAVKAGRLAQAAPDSDQLSLLVADVPLKELGAVASAPTLPNRTPFKECEAILARYHVLEQFPATVRSFFSELRAGVFKMPPEPDDPVFAHSEFQTLLSNHDFANAARDHARCLGYRVVIDNSCDDWDYAEASRYLLARFHELRASTPRLCLISSGELTVKLPAEHGCGGRNQQFALACAFDLAQYEGQNLVALSAGSDGIDGNSPAAGALVDTTTLARARSQRFDPEEHFRRFDACPLFTAIGDSIVTGPTGNNLRDLRVFLSDDGSQ